MPVSDFKVVEALGKGSFADVYKVKRKSDNKVYALKRVKIGQMSKRAVEDALSEIRFLASIRHKNIVGFLEAYTEDNGTELHIVMEHCGNGDLAQKVERYKKQRKYIDEDTIWRYLIQSLKALEYLHDKGICHRDLKTANTFIGEDGSLKIGDMNISKKLKEGNLKTQIGTPYYMSPEIWEQTPYNNKCDMWSLGCMIYELCCLRPPFIANDMPRLKRAVLSGRYPMIPNRYSEALGRAIAAMLKTNPSNRISAAALLQSPAVTAKLHLDVTDPGTSRSDNGPNLLNTIHAPRHMRNLGSALPKPCYPDTRPNSPGAWTVEEQYTARRKREEQEAIVEKARLAQLAAIPDTVDENSEDGYTVNDERGRDPQQLHQHNSGNRHNRRSKSRAEHTPDRDQRGNQGNNDEKKVWFRENTRDEHSRKQLERAQRDRQQQHVEENIQKIHQYQRKYGDGNHRNDGQDPHQNGKLQRIHNGGCQLQQARIGGVKLREDGRIAAVPVDDERLKREVLLRYKKKKLAQDNKGYQYRTPAEERQHIRAQQQRANIFWG